MSQVLAPLVVPGPSPVPAGERAYGRGGRALGGREKAAIIVRLLMAEGTTLPLQTLSEDHQTALTEQIGQMKLVDRDTMLAVITEFSEALQSIGLSFPGGLAGAIRLMDSHLSPPAANRLRRMAGTLAQDDPWESIARLDPERLLPVLRDESIEVGAVLLSKLPVARAADLLGRLPGDRARRIAYAVAQTGDVAPQTVLRIGKSLAAQLDMRPERAFDTGPVQRVGAILNFSPSSTRDAVMAGLAETDARFADEVRKTIFTFADIPARIEPRDIAKLVRAVDQPTLVMALAGAGAPEASAVEFILTNMSQRMAAALREEMDALPKIKEKEIEAAKSAVVAAVRTLEDAGDITLISPDEPE